jgi:outer membrane lipoprotein-sorting protein
MSRFFPRLSVAFVLSAGVLASAQQPLPPAEEKALIAKLQQQREQMPAITGNFTEQKVTRLLTKPIVSTGTIAFQAPNKFRRELSGNNPSTTVCDGQVLWIYYPNFKEAEKYTLGQKQFFDESLAALTAGLNFQGVEKFFRVDAMKEGSGYRVELTPRTGGLKRILTALTVWMDADGMIQKTDASLPKGDRVTTTYRNVHAAKQSDAKFEFALPAGVTVSTPLGK